MAQEHLIERTFDRNGALTIDITDVAQPGQLSTGAVERLADLKNVTWTIGLGDTRDVDNAFAPGGTLVSARDFRGIEPGLVFHSLSRGSCGAFVSIRGASALGLRSAAGAIRYADGGTEAVCGTFTGSPHSADLGADVLVSDPNWFGPVREILVGVSRADAVQPVAQALRGLLGVIDQTELRVDVPSGLGELKALTASESSRFGHRMVVVFLAVALILIMGVVYFAVTVRRRDFGRRRALGASRRQLCALVDLQFAAPSVVGVVLGALASRLVLQHWVGADSGLRFDLAVATLVMLASMSASVIPAIVAAFGDPLSVLRTP